MNDARIVPEAVERVLACPSCHGDLACESRAFRCRACGAAWPVVKRVPRFVGSQHYATSFGFEWRRHRRTQLAGEKARETERTFEEKTGLTPADVKGKLVLDIGVGTGRFADVVARWGGIPVGVDLSLAVLSARSNLARYPAAFVAQADLFHLPFRAGSFDIVFSIGVLHHTPSTHRAFSAVAPLVRPGGVLAVAVYQAHPFLAYSRRYRRYTCAMSHGFLHLVSHAAIARPFFIDAARLVLGDAFADDLEGALYASDHRDALWRVLDTFDWYSPRFQWLHEEPEVCGWFDSMGFEDVRRLPEQTMVSVRGRRSMNRASQATLRDDEDSNSVSAELPFLVPAREGVLRDLILSALLTAAVARSVHEVAAAHAVSWLTKAVVSAKRAFGVERRLLRPRRGQAPSGNP